MKLNVKHLQEHKYLIVPIITLLLLGVLYRYSSTQKIIPTELSGQHVNLTSQIEIHIKTIARKIKDSTSYTPRSLTLRTTQHGQTLSRADNTSTLRSSFSSKDLQGIAFLATQPLVFIKNRVLKEGDQIEGFTIEEINETDITVRDHGGKTTTIYLDPSKQPEN